jgi:hypothetical protein
MISHVANQMIIPNVKQSSQAIALTTSGGFCCHGRRRSKSTLYRRRGRRSPRCSTKSSKKSRGRIGGFLNEERAMSGLQINAAPGLQESSMFSACFTNHNLLGVNKSAGLRANRSALRPLLLSA